MRRLAPVATGLWAVLVLFARNVGHRCHGYFRRRTLLERLNDRNWRSS